MNTENNSEINSSEAEAKPQAEGTPEKEKTAEPEGVALIGFDTFEKVNLLTAEIVEATLHPKADRLLVLQLKVGERRKQIVAGIREFYQPEELTGKIIILVDNLKPAKLRGEKSEGMLLAVRLPEGGLRLLTTDGPAPSGLEVG